MASTTAGSNWVPALHRSSAQRLCLAPGVLVTAVGDHRVVGVVEGGHAADMVKQPRCALGEQLQKDIAGLRSVGAALVGVHALVGEPETRARRARFIGQNRDADGGGYLKSASALGQRGSGTGNQAIMARIATFEQDAELIAAEAVGAAQIGDDIA
jgi:hypothetical protein